MAEQKLTWRQERLALADLQPFEKNPRRFTEKGLSDLEESVSRFGMAEPVVVNLDGTVIGGHARRLVADRLGETEVDCWRPSRQLTPTEVAELNVRLNKNIAGEWDPELLAANFEIEWLESWGFSEAELLRLLGTEMKGGEGPPGGFPSAGQLEITHVCPKCGYEWR